MRTGNHTERRKLGEMEPPRTHASLHIATYLNPETVEKVAILQARLGLDNSKLIKPVPLPGRPSHPSRRPLSRRHRPLPRWSRRRWPSSNGCRRYRRPRSAR
jgi:hypothetical protein